MLVSIVVPSFNHARFLPAALDSILSQEHRPLEIIVVDGASTDGTRAILEDYGRRHPELRWISEPDNGPADAVNKGLRMATGELVGIQSSDDLYYPGALAAVVKAAEAHPQCGFLYGDVDGIDTDGRLLGQGSLPEFSWDAFFGIAMCIPQGSILFRRSLYTQVGGWNPKYYGCDLDFWMRLLFRTQALKIPRALSCWRMYPEQRTRHDQFQRIWDGYWQMIDDSEDVRRASPRIRRLAHASRHILSLTVHPTGNPWAIRWHLLCATILHPGFWRYQKRSRWIHLVPGQRAVRAAYRRVRALIRRNAPEAAT